jgi:predicted TIM-barrel fold metal-dependent hydrolase
MELVIDADGHVLEPPDVWERYVEPAYRSRAIRVRRGADGRDALEIDGRPARLTTPEMLGGLGGMGKSVAELAAACVAGRYAESAPAAATDAAARLALLDGDGIAKALLYPSLGLQWEAEVPDAAYALAHARAYNRWIEEFCAGSRGRLLPVAHLVLGDPTDAARELRRAVRAVAGGFLLPFTLSGVPHGHPDHDVLFAAAEELDVPIALHTGVDPPARDLHRRFTGLTWPEGVLHGIWYLQLMFAQAVQQAFSTFFLHATFDRFPRLARRARGGAGWLGYWPIGWTPRARAAAGDAAAPRAAEHVRPPAVLGLGRPDERSLPAVLRYVGDDRFLWATDYPHSDHDASYMEELRELADALRRRAVAGSSARTRLRLIRSSAPRLRLAALERGTPRVWRRRFVRMACRGRRSRRGRRCTGEAAVFASLVAARRGA